MCSRNAGVAALGAILIAGMLAACSAGPSSSPLQQLNQAQAVSVQSQERPDSVPQLVLPSIASQLRLFQAPALVAARPDRGGAWVYTADLYGNDLTVYQRSGNGINFFEKITQGISQPAGTVSTTNGWWYVTNSGHSNVLVYKTTNNGPVGPMNTLDDTGEIPTNVDADSSRRLVAVSNYSTASAGPGSVSVYLDRSAIPTSTLTYGSDNIRGMGVALDHQGDCYWSFNDPATGSGSIVEFAGCSMPGSLVIGGLHAAGGIVFDQSDNLYYIDQNAGVYQCKKTQNCQLFATGFGDPINLNFDHKDKLIWVSDASGYVDYVNPKTGKVTMFPAYGGPTDPPIGIAPAPGG